MNGRKNPFLQTAATDPLFCWGGKLDLDMHRPDVIGPFRVIARLSESEQTETLLGHDQNLGREVIITRLAASASRDQVHVEGFQRKVRKLGKIQHPNVVPIHAINLEASQPYFVTARVDGETLDAVLRQRGPLELGESIQIILDVLDGLGAAHDQGTCHGHLTTSAITIERSQGRALLGDFSVIPARIARSQCPAEHSGHSRVHSSHPWNSQEQELREDLRSVGRVFLSLLTIDRDSHSGVAHSEATNDVVFARSAHTHGCVEAPHEVWELVLQLFSDSSETAILKVAGIRERLARVPVHGSTGSMSRQCARAESFDEPRAFRERRGIKSLISDWAQSLRSITSRASGDFQRNERRENDFGDEDRRHSILLGYRKDGLAVLDGMINRVNSDRERSDKLLSAIAEQRRELAEIDRLIRRLDRRKAQRSRYLPSASHAAGRQVHRNSAARRWKNRWTTVAGIVLGTMLFTTIAVSTQAFRSQPLDAVSITPNTLAPASIKADADRIIDQHDKHGRLLTQELSLALHESHMASEDVVALAFDPSRERLHEVTRVGLLETTFVSDGLRQKPFSPWANVALASQVTGTDLVVIRHQGNAAEQQQQISIVDLASGNEPLLMVSVSNTERVVGAQREPFRLWTLDADSERQRLLEYDSEGRSTQIYQLNQAVALVAVGRDSAFVATVGSPHGYEVIEPGTGATSRLVPSRMVETISGDTAGHWLATHGGDDRRIDLFSTRTKQVTASLQHEQPGQQIQFDHEGRRLAVATAQDVRIWDLALCYVRIRIPVGDVRLMRFSADGGRLAVLRESGKLSVWNTEFPVLRTKRREDTEVVNSTRMGGLDASTNGKETSHQAKTTTSDGRLTIRWTSNEGAVLEETDSGHVLLKYSFTTPSVVAISPDDRLVAFGGTDQLVDRMPTEQIQVAICDLRTGSRIRDFRITAHHLFCLDFSPSHDVLYGGGLRTVYAWELATNNATREYTTLIPYVYRVRQSLDGRRLVFSDYRPEDPARGVGSRVHAVDSAELLWDASANEWPNLIRPLEELVDTRFGKWKATSSSLKSAENK